MNNGSHLNKKSGFKMSKESQLNKKSAFSNEQGVSAQQEVRVFK